jgi:hypothetical protein
MSHSQQSRFRRGLAAGGKHSRTKLRLGQDARSARVLRDFRHVGTGATHGSPLVNLLAVGIDKAS